MAIVERHGGLTFPMNDYEMLVNDPQVQHLGMVQAVEQPGAGAIHVLAPPWEFSETPAELRLPAPLSEQEVRTLRGVVTALSKGRGKVLEKLAAKRRKEGSA